MCLSIPQVLQKGKEENDADALHQQEHCLHGMNLPYEQCTGAQAYLEEEDEQGSLFPAHPEAYKTVMEMVLSHEIDPFLEGGDLPAHDP
jgi:hypothetical protein